MGNLFSNCYDVNKENEVNQLAEYQSNLGDVVGEQSVSVDINNETLIDSFKVLDTNIDSDGSDHNIDEEYVFSEGFDQRHNRSEMPPVSIVHQKDAMNSDSHCHIINEDLTPASYLKENLPYPKAQQPSVSYSDDANFSDCSLLHQADEMLSDGDIENVQQHVPQTLTQEEFKSAIKRIRATELLPRLYAEGLISQNDREEIEREDINNGNIAAFTVLLCRINIKLSGWYTKFIDVLRDEDFPELDDYITLNLQRTGAHITQETDSQEPISHTLSEGMDYEEMVKIYKPLIIYQHLQRTGAHISQETASRSQKLVSHEMSEDMEYGEMVELYKPLIEANLIVREILPHLPFIENQEDLYAVEQRSPREAVICLLDALKSCKEVGKWQIFIKALKQCGYEHIVENIKGYIFINDDNIYQRQYIRKLSGRLIKRIRATELLPRLYAEGLISQNDREEIEREDINSGNIAASTMLLSRIPRKLTAWYTKFIDVLRDEDFPEIADYLTLPYLNASSKIKEQHPSLRYSDYDNPQLDEMLSDGDYGKIDDNLHTYSNSHKNYLQVPDDHIPHEQMSLKVQRHVKQTQTQDEHESGSFSQEPISHELREGMDYEEMVKMYKPLVAYQHLQRTGAHITQETASRSQKLILHEMSEDMEYGEMVELYKPLIEANLIVREILPHLPFIENQEDLYAVEKRSPREAVICLLDALKSCKEVGKWQIFIEALKQCGYEHIVENIKGYIYINDNIYQRQYIRKLSGRLIKRIRATELLPRLYAEGLISQNDREEIEREDINSGNIAASTMLLSRIPRKLTAWYTKFIDVLRDEDFPEIADYLTLPYLNASSKIKEQHPSVRYSDYDNPQLDEMLSDGDYGKNNDDLPKYSFSREKHLQAPDDHLPLEQMTLKVQQHVPQTLTQEEHESASCSQEPMSHELSEGMDNKESVKIYTPLIVCHEKQRSVYWTYPSYDNPQSDEMLYDLHKYSN